MHSKLHIEQNLITEFDHGPSKGFLLFETDHSCNSARIVNLFMSHTRLMLVSKWNFKADETQYENHDALSFSC